MSNKKSSYQRLKERNAELRRDIDILIGRDTTFFEQQQTKGKYMMMNQMVDAIMEGSILPDEQLYQHHER